jgi:hypothetical protein
MLYHITMCVLILNAVILAWALRPTADEASRTTRAAAYKAMNVRARMKPFPQSRNRRLIRSLVMAATNKSMAWRSKSCAGGNARGHHHPLN